MKPLDQTNNTKKTKIEIIMMKIIGSLLMTMKWYMSFTRKKIYFIIIIFTTKKWDLFIPVCFTENPFPFQFGLVGSFV